MRCPQCGHVNEAGKKFCPKCGASLAEAARIESEQQYRAHLQELEEQRKAAVLEQERLDQEQKRKRQQLIDRLWGDRTRKIRTITVGSAVLVVIALITDGIVVRRNALQHKVVGEMVVVPAGTFMMGSPSGESVRFKWEGPQHSVNIKGFQMGKYDITFEQWDACVADGGCANYSPPDQGWGRGTRPVVNVSWNDAQQFILWVNKKTNQTYRLPTEAEWEYSARAGTSSAYYWGDTIDPTRLANNHRQTEPVGNHLPNAFGLYDMSGNVSQLVQDCWHDSYVDAPTDGSAWVSGIVCSRVRRGGAFDADAAYLRVASRSPTNSLYRVLDEGFRLARDQ